MKQCTEPRDRINRLLVVVNAAERDAIEARAKATGLSVSSYLRATGMGRHIWGNAALNHEQVLALAKVNADQGRLGGLLKMWLVDRPGRGASEFEVRRLLNEIRDLQGRLAEIAERI
jgi:hypothetical protein